MLGFQKGVVIAVHQTFPMDYSCIVHQYCNISNLRLKSATMKKRPAPEDVFPFAFVTRYSRAAPELSAMLPAHTQTFQMKCNLYTRWESSSEPKYIQRTEASQRKSGSLCASIEIPPYLFSNHLGLLVNLLPIGHITQEVMALSS